MFRNNTFSHGLEVDLTDAVAKELRRTTGWRVVDEGSAGAVLSGVITSSEMRALSIQRQTGLTQALGVTITATGPVYAQQVGATGGAAFGYGGRGGDAGLDGDAGTGAAP